MRITLIGYKNEQSSQIGGQPLKTAAFLQLLIELFGTKEVFFLNTNNWKKKPITFFIKLIFNYFKSDIIFSMPAHNGVKTITNIFFYLAKFRRPKLYYVVIGGWLPQLLKENKVLRFKSGVYDSILVETSSMKQNLEMIGITNSRIMNNFYFKKAPCIFDNHPSSTNEFRLCFISRVIPEKGIEDVIEAISIIHETTKLNIVLDIYGPGNLEYIDTITSNKTNIHYRGTIKPENVSNIMSTYFLHIFPTKYKTEGVPGSIIEGFFAGVPTIAARWESCSDVIVDYHNGISYTQNDLSDLINKIIWACSHTSEVISMKRNAIDSAKNYDIEYAKNFLNNLLEINRE